MKTSWSKRLYRLGVGAYHLGIRAASPFSSRAHAWVQGRKDTAKDLEAFRPGKLVCWFHCASLGEFEQGRPLLEMIRSRHPEAQIVLTFFSPSGYTLRKNYSQADLVLYLPADSPENAGYFLEKLQPRLAIFIKYEFWGSYLEALQQRQIPVFLISAIFRRDQPFFRWWGSYHRQMLACFEQILVQDQVSADLLRSIGIPSAISPDLRFDRVLQIAGQSPDVGLVKEMSAHRILMAGSTWPEDEQYLSEAFFSSWQEQGFKLVIAPHEPSEKHLRNLEKRFRGEAVRMSQAELPICPKILIIDTVGLLSSIYRYAFACYIGGGFGAGIHNTLEAAVYGKPIAFGPRYEKFREARDLVAMEVAKVVNRPDELAGWLEDLSENEVEYTRKCAAASEYVRQHSGGTATAYQKISDFLSAES